MRRLVLLIAAVISVLLVVSALRSTWLLGWAMVHDIVRPASRPVTPWLGWSPEVSALSIPHPHGATRALLVRPRDASPGSGMVLVHGMVATGEEDWRLRRLAATLSAGGFTVLVPAVPGLKRGVLVEEDIDVVAAVVSYIHSMEEAVDPERVGVVGISVGGGPALAAAARLPSTVAFAGAFGGYYDLSSLVKGLVEAGRSLEGELVTTDRWAFFAANVHIAADPKDRVLLLRVAAVPPRERAERMKILAGRLSPAGRAILEIITTEDPERVEALLERAGPVVARLRRALSPRYYAERLTMKLFLAHGRPDPVIHHTETLRLAAALPAGADPTVSILPLFTHVDPRPGEAGPAGRWEALRRLHRLLMALLAQRP